VAHATRGLDLYVVRQTVQQAEWIKWMGRAELFPTGPLNIYLYDSREILGVVPAFNLGVAQALKDGHQIIACFHDDLEIEEAGWDNTVISLFKACPRAGLVGFGGAKGLGEEDIYRTPYNPMQLVRKRFISNMRHAEVHGERCEVACPVACLDGFSQVGLASYWRGWHRDSSRQEYGTDPRHTLKLEANLFGILEAAGVVHHAYDAALGAFAAQLGYQVWFSPIKVHHHGGLTAVADSRYLNWALQTYEYEDLERPEKGVSRGDAAFWEKSHRAVYELFRGVLPIRVT
jgi:hypothetical protein